MMGDVGLHVVGRGLAGVGGTFGDANSECGRCSMHGLGCTMLDGHVNVLPTGGASRSGGGGWWAWACVMVDVGEKAAPLEQSYPQSDLQS